MTTHSLGGSIHFHANFVIILVYLSNSQAHFMVARRRGRPKLHTASKSKKAVLLASICFLTDILALLASQFLAEPNISDPAPIFDFGANLVINHLVTIA